MRFLVCLLIVAALAGCQSYGPKPQVKQAPTAPSQVIAAGQSVRPVSLERMVYAAPPGKGVDYIEAGAFCLPAAKRDNDRKPSFEDPKVQQVMLSLVASSLESRGYVVDEGGSASLALASEFVAYTNSSCFPYSGLGNARSGHGEVWIQMHWVLTDRASGTVLLDSLTEGTARIPDLTSNLYLELLRRSMDQAAGNLANDPAFLAAVGGTASAAAAAGAPATAGKAPTAPSTMSQDELERAQGAFDSWLGNNRDALAQAMARHLSDLAVKLVAVGTIEAAKVRDVTGEGYIVELTYMEDQRETAALFLVALNSGQLLRVQKLQ